MPQSGRRRSSGRGPADYNGAESETETESSPSGYGTETSADTSTDTDIDAMVDEYRKEASLPESMSACPASEVKRPDRATANVVVMATAVLLGSFILQFIILENVKRYSTA